MSVNVLGYRKLHKITAATGLPVLRAWVRSHEESGRRAYLTIGWTAQCRHHRHAWYDRHIGALEFVPAGQHNTSCRQLFPGETPATDDRVTVLAALLLALDGPW